MEKYSISISLDALAGTPEQVILPKALQAGLESGSIKRYALFSIKVLDAETQQSSPDGVPLPAEDQERRILELTDLKLKELLGQDAVMDRFLVNDQYCWLIHILERIQVIQEQQVLPDLSYLHTLANWALKTQGAVIQVYTTKSYSKASEYYSALEELFLRMDAASFLGTSSDVVGFHYNDVPNLKDNLENFSEVKLYYEKLFFNYVMAYRFPQACETFLKIVDLELTQPETAVSLRSRIPERLMWVMYVLGSPAQEIVLATKNNVRTSIRELGQLTSISQMRQQIPRIFSIIEEDYCGDFEQSQSTFDRVTEFIEENYSNPNLDSTMISEQFGISPAYLSRLFRQRASVSMVSFIHNTRLSHLKQLLLTTEEPVNVLAPLCGYTSLWTMFRAFKKYEGITPGEYRSQQHQSQNRPQS